MIPETMYTRFEYKNRSYMHHNATGMITTDQFMVPSERDLPYIRQAFRQYSGNHKQCDIPAEHPDRFIPVQEAPESPSLAGRILAIKME